MLTWTGQGHIVSCVNIKFTFGLLVEITAGVNISESTRGCNNLSRRPALTHNVLLGGAGSIVLLMSVIVWFIMNAVIQGSRCGAKLPESLVTMWAAYTKPGYCQKWSSHNSPESEYLDIFEPLSCEIAI